MADLVRFMSVMKSPLGRVRNNNKGYKINCIALIGSKDAICIRSKICCIFKNLAVNYFRSNDLYSSEPFPNRQQMFSLC